MFKPLQSLIDKQDNIEIVRDQIVALLKNEIVNQQNLATNEGKNPDDWKLRIFLERSTPWEIWLNSQDDLSPLVNVWVDNAIYNLSASNIVKTQRCETIFNIDIYGIGESADDAQGHISGDKKASLEAQRTVRLVRNILRASTNTHLQLDGLVGNTWFESVTFFQPERSGTQIQRIMGARMKLLVTFNEYSPQYEGGIIETITATVKSSETDEILLETEYDYTN